MLNNKKGLSLQSSKYQPSSVNIPVLPDNSNNELLILVRQAAYSAQVNQVEEKNRHVKEKVDEEKSLLEGIMFDINNFNRPKEIGISEEIKWILKMPPEKRTSNHIKEICTALIEAVPEFTEFTPRIQKSIAQLALLQEFETGRIIIRQNHRADNYYFIVSGVASVYVSKKNRTTGDTENRNVAFLRKGKSFGELAIINGSARNENVICHTNVSVLCIDRDDFIKIFMNKEEGKESEYISFLRQIDIMKMWPLDELPDNDPRICLLTFFRKGIVMCKNNLKNDWVFVVKQGSCKIVKNVTIPKLNLVLTKRPLNTPINYFDFHSKNERYTSILRHEINNEFNLQYNFDKISEVQSDDEDDPIKSFVKENEKSVYVEIKRLKPKEVFGLLEMTYNFEEEQNRAILISDGVECIMINKKFFLKYMTPSNKNLLRNLVHPYPTELELQKKLQIQSGWNNYKKDIVTKKTSI
ncbi:unnamed protein product [Brachionus calyciflorus]|uniref:Cyclic nucleotide-binding domain-containing protein n=1 Tax=Brachionus calyciflorus TaxID=104777 RepID=A0A814D3V6_9BILA|nr:unnamed protein product [Brachionus calyciflorus]